MRKTERKILCLPCLTKIREEEAKNMRILRKKYKKLDKRKKKQGK